MQKPLASLPAREVNERTADPAIFCGGGSVAALSGAAAGSLVLLVLRLARKRRSNAARQGEIDAAIADISRLIEELYAAADADIAYLDDLLEAQRRLKEGSEGTERRDYLAALSAAAESPIRLSESIEQLVEIVDQLLETATRFTISDLGAAAVLADGACRAALLTAEVNLALLRDAEDSDPTAIQTLESRRARVAARVHSLAESIEGATRRAIHREDKESGRQA